MVLHRPISFGASNIVENGEMSARLLKKVLKEQEALQHQQQHIHDDCDSKSMDSSGPSRNLFDLLGDEGDADGDLQHLDHSFEKKDTVSGYTSCNDTLDEHSSMQKVALSTVLMQNVKSKRKKKKKLKEDLFQSSENDASLSTLMLENLNLGAGSSSNQQIDTAKSKLGKKEFNDIMVKQCRSSILQVDPKFLRAESELRRIFGSKVVKSYERNQFSTSSRQIRGGRRGNHNLKKTILVYPSEHWPRWDGSLSMELLETRDGVLYFRYVHSASYAQAQRAFEAAKAIHDLNGIANVLLYHPYHIESLMTLADYFKLSGEHQMSADATAKCLYAMECAWHPLFTPSKNCQLKYVHDTNKPFFSSLFSHMKNMDRRGCHRSALEICKLLLSLDSDDPVGAIFCIDYYSLRAEEYAWLEHFAEEYKCDNSLWLFPNFSYSLAVCRFYLELSENKSNREIDTGKAPSIELMKQALMLHPPVLGKLAVKVPLKDQMWAGVLGESFFRSEETGNASLNHLIALYVEKSYLIWRLPDLQKLLYDSVILVIDILNKKGNEVRDWACVREEAFSSAKNEYSHLLVSEFSDVTPTVPPDNLQDFMIDRRAEFENDEEFPNIPEEHLHRDVSNRNALAVLFESMLPWVTYGTRDSERTQLDLPEEANED